MTGDKRKGGETSDGELSAKRFILLCISIQSKLIFNQIQEEKMLGYHFSLSYSLAQNGLEFQNNLPAQLFVSG